MLTRRHFLLSSALLPAIPALPRFAIGPRYSLLIKGGRVLDPSQKLDGLLDVAVKDGKIAAVKANIPASDAAEVIDAAGRIVTPGLIDMHAHPRPNELSPARVLAGGVTTVCDAGSRGSSNIQDMVEVAAKAPNRVRVLMNIGKRGNDTVNGELNDFSNIDIEASQKAVREHRDLIVGIKIRLSQPVVGKRDLEAIKLAHQVTKPAGIPLMLHVGETYSTLPQIVAVLNRGDIVTHLYTPPPNDIFDGKGKILPEIYAARKRGIFFDFGHGLNKHFTWEAAESALKQDFPPDTITSDLNGNGLVAQVFDLPNVLSKFLLLGMSLDQVIARATVNCSKVIPALKGLGTLKTGSIADITVLELKQGEFEFVDNAGGKRTGRQKLFARAVVVGGKPWTGEMSPPPPAEPRA